MRKGFTFRILSLNYQIDQDFVIQREVNEKLSNSSVH